MFSWYCMDNVLNPALPRRCLTDYCAILQAVIAAPESLKTLASGIAGHIPPPTLAAERAGGLRPAGY